MTYTLPNAMPQDERMRKGFNELGDYYHKLVNNALRREQEKRLAEQFKQEFGLKKAAAGRNEQLFPLKLQALKNKLDPDYEYNNMLRQYHHAQKDFGGENVGGQGESTNDIMHQQLPDENANPLLEQLKSMGMFKEQGQGALLPEELRPLPGDGQMTGAQLDEYAKKKNIQPWEKSFGKQMEKKGLINPFYEDKNNVLHGPARDAADLVKLKKERGENSEEYQTAKAISDAKIAANKDLRDLRARTKAGLKPGEKEFFDATTGEPLGKEIPLTATERASEEGNILFNEFYPVVYKGAAPFSGEGSIRRLEQAAANYKTDPKARKLFDDFLLSDKALAATVINEASTLKAGKQNRTYGILKESLEAQDIPKVVKKLIKEYQIPASAQLKAAMRYQKLLSDARIKARKGTPATQKLFYNPEMQAQHEKQQNEGLSKETKVINGVTYYADGQGGWEHD